MCDGEQQVRMVARLRNTDCCTAHLELMTPMVGRSQSPICPEPTLADAKPPARAVIYARQQDCNTHLGGKAPFAALHAPRTVTLPLRRALFMHFSRSSGLATSRPTSPGPTQVSTSRHPHRPQPPHSTSIRLRRAHTRTADTPTALFPFTMHLYFAASLLVTFSSTGLGGLLRGPRHR